jgi:hypothetical protein
VFIVTLELHGIVVVVVGVSSEYVSLANFTMQQPQYDAKVEFN